MGAAKLIVNPTSSSRREIPLSHTLVSIGRDPSNDVVLPDAMVSRRHAVIECRGSQYYLRDCNSSNGSLVNGDRVSERSLRDGDLVAIGTARLLFRDEPQLEEVGAKVVPHPSSPKLVCPACRADFRTGDAFCRQCGAPLTPATPPKVVCASCGTVVPLPARFCNACGMALPARGPLDAERQRVASSAAAPASPFAATVPPLEAAGSPLAVVPPLPSARATTTPPVGLQRASSAKPAPVAGLGRRLAAGLIDASLTGLLQIVLLAPALVYWRGRTPGDATWPSVLLSVALLSVVLAAGAAYYVYFWGVQGATPGKRLLGLVVESQDGERPIGSSRALLRLLAFLLTCATLGVGFLVAASGGLALHDRIARTRVARRKEA